jgi:cellulose synthase (UDP-forming)
MNRWTAPLLLAVTLSFPLAAPAAPPLTSSERSLRDLDELSALWSFYKHTYIADGRVVSLDEGGITTSEGQGYAMLRAVWSNDRRTFTAVWDWTKRHLQRGDRLFAWKWNGRVLSPNSATDADTDIALALILAARRFSVPAFEREALEILDAIWRTEILQVGRRYYVTAGNWAVPDEYPTIHVAYLAPYAYQVFASVDDRHPWKRLVDSSYEVLHWIYFDQKLPLPPDVVFVDKATGRLRLQQPRTGTSGSFSYDAFPLFWRVALDASWFGRSEAALRRTMLQFFEQEWQRRQRFFDHYTVRGQPLSRLEGLPLYATVQSLARHERHPLAAAIGQARLAALRQRAQAGSETPYYLHNWLWFGQAFELQQLRTYDEFLGFLRPFDVQGFAAHFPWAVFGLTLLLFVLAPFHPLLKLAFLGGGFYLGARYLGWRLLSTLNVLETAGPFISISLWLAELYAFSTVVLLFVQLGLGRARPPQGAPDPPPGFAPSVDILIPIYTEPGDILEQTLIGAGGLDYPNARVFVLDDGHRPEVARLAARYGAGYIEGPRRHAKAGNLNHALARTDGELVAVFDTDHVPVTTFLKETVPWFADPALGFVQTPHHFYNQDIFQRAFGAGARIPNEQDLFNHAIQGGRQAWNGTVFVGSGAVFRRAALAQIGGFSLLSITEDIHTSQRLHAAGWRSAFVDKDLAAGLTAENLASHLVQRRRWMLGCLQILFTDNPLVCRGLTARQRLGYFASLYYFLFPAARMIFWVTPLYFLWFHLHPIFSEVSVLVAHLLPFLIVLPLIAYRLLPGWPRLLWSSVYEMTVSFPLFRSMFDLLLPKRMAFTVTPKGLRSDRRVFDLGSSAGLVAAAAVSLGGIVKGLWEFLYFGIEKDAYFFNLAWASFNLVFVLIGLLVAWEKPQRRTAARITRSLPFTLKGKGFLLKGQTHDVSVSGFSFISPPAGDIPPVVEATLLDRAPITARCRVVYHEPVSRHSARCGLAFLDPSESRRRQLIRRVLADPETWAAAHAGRLRTSLGMAASLLYGVVHGLVPARARRRRSVRRTTLRPVTVRIAGHPHTALLRDWSSRGLGVFYWGRAVPDDTVWALSDGSFDVVHRRRLFRSLWRVGLRARAEAGTPLAEPAAAAVHPDARS